MVPFLMRITNNQTERQMVLSELPWRSTERYEAEAAIPQRIGAIQPRKRRKNIKNTTIYFLEF